MGILFIIYLILGYWAVGQTIFANKVRIGTMGALFFQQFCLALFLGWILIPIAIIKLILANR